MMSRFIRLPQPRRALDDPVIPAVLPGPVADVAELLEEISRSGLDPRAQAFISFQVRMHDRSSWERAISSAASSASASWQVAAYSQPSAYMLRLSRQSDVARPTLERLCAAVETFTADHDAEWESVTVEQPSRANVWRALQAQQRATVAAPRDTAEDTAATAG